MTQTLQNATMNEREAHPSIGGSTGNESATPIKGSLLPGRAYGYGDVVARRTAAESAAFLLPHLRPGMSLLDCGCGGGSISLGLAEQVAPGEVVGVDLDPKQIELARANAAEKGATANIRFEQADVSALPFPDNTFDAVFVHAVYEHLRYPAKATRQILRVLKPGGIFGVRDRSSDGDLLIGASPAVMRAGRLFNRRSQQGGTDYRTGARLGQFLRTAGFRDVRLSASYESHTAKLTGNFLARSLWNVPQIELTLRLGRMDQEALDRLCAACLAWAEQSDAHFFMARGEAIGWKPD